MPLAQALDMFLYPVLAQDISHKPRVCLNNEDVVVTWYSLTELSEISIKMKFLVLFSLQDLGVPINDDFPLFQSWCCRVWRTLVRNGWRKS